MPKIMIVWLASAAQINNDPRKPTIVISCPIGLPRYAHTLGMCINGGHTSGPENA